MKKILSWVGLVAILGSVAPMNVVAETLDSNEVQVQSTSESEVISTSETSSAELMTTTSETAETTESSSTVSSSEMSESTESSTTASVVEQKPDAVKPQINQLMTAKQSAIGKYLTLLQTDGLKIYADENLTEEVAQPNILFNQTYRVDAAITDSQNQATILGYKLVNKDKHQTFYLKKDDRLKFVDSFFGSAQTVTRPYYTVMKQSIPVYDMSGKVAQANHYQKVVKATEKYLHFDGQVYLRVQYKDNQGQEQNIGLVNEADLKQNAKDGHAENGHGISADYYVTVTYNKGSIYEDFFKVVNYSKNFYNQTLRVKEVVPHYNGAKYLRLYNNKNKVIGYINEGFTRKAPSKGGIYKAKSGYVTITSSNFTRWNNFDFQKRGDSKNMKHQTYRTYGYYDHFNGARYYSIKDNKGRWLGYINAGFGKFTTNAQGVHIKQNQYVSFTSKNYRIYSNFNWKKKADSKTYYHKTVRVTGVYAHYNGAKYYSMSDNKGKWIGYVNSGATRTGNGRGGIYHSVQDNGKVRSKNYAIYSNFNFKKKSHTSKYYNQELRVAGKYIHYNGATYYSLYTKKGQWIGYVNSGAVFIKNGVAAFMGTTRTKFLANLKKHENDGYYLGTRYKGLGWGSPEQSLLSPKGRPNRYGAGMNCTGWVAVALQDGGGDLNQIRRNSNGYGGATNAVNWRNALTKNSKYYTYRTVNDLLKSGRAKKGDLIYLEMVFGTPGADCHIGVFYGNNGKQNVFWHQVLRGNIRSNIFSGTPYSKVYLFPMD